MDSILTKENSKNNYYAFIWHGIFLSLATNFMDIHTIIPSMLIKAGGNAILLGILTTIMVGGSSLMQIVFAGYLSNKTNKKAPLILGINLRVIALLFLAFILLQSEFFSNNAIILFIFILISIFSFSGSFANISYIDIVGKSIIDKKRKHFFSLKQTISSIGIFASAIIVRALLKRFSYPVNYGISLLCAGILLLIASIGFWKINEIVIKIKNKRKFWEYIKIIPREISENSNLKNYLFIINLLGLGLSFIPFMVLFAKKNFELNYGLIGNILLFKIIGMLVTSLILYKISRKIDYKKLLYFSFAIGISIPIFSLIFSSNYFMYQLIFILAGVLLSSFKIAKNGILVEISNNENRATYTGISGAGSILPTIFPLITGILITILGYYFTFILVLLIIASSSIFIKNLKCE
ncbi:MAG: MFS transporter [Candidatus Marinimicrobia bacterium]|nr:MFS transporter [Candidatus Neomarinimicrobiota bacterium]